MITTTPWSLRIPQHGDSMAAEILDKSGNVIGFMRDWAIAQEIVELVNLWAKGKGSGLLASDLSL